MAARSPRVVVRLTAIVLIALNAIVVALTLVAIQQLHAHSVREAETRSQNLALAIDQSLSVQISKIDLSLRTVIAELERHDAPIEGAALNVVRSLIHQQKSLLPEVEDWGVADADGEIVFHDVSIGPARFSIADRDYFRDLKSSSDDRLLISKPLLSRLTGEPILVFARAIIDRRGKFAGIVAMPLPLANLNRFLAGFAVGSRGALTLRDKDFALISRLIVGNDGVFTTTDDARVSPEFSRTVSSEKAHATFHGITPFDQVERISSYRRLSNAPIHAFVGISKADFLEQWRQTALRFAAFLALFLLVGNGLVWALHRILVRQKHVASQLRESNMRLEASLKQLIERDGALFAAQEAGGLGTYTMRIADGTWACSEKLHAIFGIDPSYPHTYDGWRQLVHAEDLSALSAHFHDDVVGRHQVFDYEYRIVRPSDQSVLWVHSLGRLDFDEAGVPVRISGTIQDISDRMAANDRQRLAQQVFDSASEGIVVTDKDGTIIETNPAFTRITGYTAEESVGRNPRILKSDMHDSGHYAGVWECLLGTGAWEGEFVNRRKDGSTFTQYSRISAIRDAHGAITHFCAVISDITQIKESQRRLEFMAYHDELTRLPNRVLLANRMREAMARCRQHGQELLTVCHLDIDDFKEINERWGHEVGDDLLIEVAKRLQVSLRTGDTVARLGGDEFVVIFTGLRDEGSARSAISRLTREVSEPYVVRSIRAELTISVGATFYPLDAVDEPDALIRHADQAMYEAKRRGRNHVRFFDRESDRRQRDRQTMHERLGSALANDELRLHYQPKVDLYSGEVVGVEALLRWQHPEEGLLPPARFLPAIETSELTFPVGEWVLHAAMQQKCNWQKQGIDLPVSVNVFGLHLQRRDFHERLAGILDAYPDVAAQGLELEILETTALENIDEITDHIAACSRLGVRFSLDDFGTGFSSLTYLRSLPAGIVKIDRSFVQDMLTNAEDQALVRGIVSMAHSLERMVIAEGVESLEHGAVLRACGCDMAQGYGISPPMPPEAVPAWLATWTLPERWKDAA